MYDEEYVEQDYGELYDILFCENEQRIMEYCIADKILMDHIKEMDRRSGKQWQ